MSVGSVSSSRGDFFLRPTNLVKGSGLRAKVGMAVLSALVFLGTGGLAHLIALGAHLWKSGGGPGAKKVNDKALESLQMPLQLNLLHFSDPQNLFKGTLKHRLTTEATVTQQKDVKVPAFVRSCIAFLEKGKNLDTVGIYRAGNFSTLYDKAKERYVQTDRTALQSSTEWVPKELSEQTDQALFAAYALKSYCRSLWGWSNEKMTAQMQQLSTPPDISSKPNLAKNRLQKLPKEEREVLLEIFTHLREVAKNSTANKMDVKNLEKMWAPSLPVNAGDITYLVGHPEVNLQQFLGLEGK